jgi:hypothetical protein
MRENNQNDSCDVKQVEPTAVVPCSSSDMDAQKSNLEVGFIGEGKRPQHVPHRKLTQVV